MNFQDAEKTYKDLKAQHAAGKLNDAEFEAEVAKLRLQDAQGHWWQVGVSTGEWYMHDGQKWNKAKPPAAAAPVVGAEPSASPESGDPKTKRTSSALPARLFSAAPAGRGGGLPRGALIVIVAVVAVVAVAILVGGFLFLSNLVGGSSSARVTTTPTRSLAILPSPVIPTITLARPTDTPLPPPTVEVAASDVTPTRTPAAVRPTATKAPTTKPAGPTATATPNVPPGLYVTKVESNPGKPSIGSSLGFHVTFLNTTGSVQVYVWQVLVYKCPEQCDVYKNSYGQTLRMTSNIGTGTVVLDSPQNINLGAGLNCDLVAIPNFIDQTNQQVVPFTSLKGNPYYYSFNVCN